MVNLRQATRPTESPPGVARLVGSILGDVQKLLQQQLDLFLQEMRDDFQKTKQGILPLLIGLPVILGGVLFLGATLALSLNWAWPDLELWACFGMVGCFWIAAAAILFFLAKKKFDSFNPLPDESVAALMENLQWPAKK